MVSVWTIFRCGSGLRSRDVAQTVAREDSQIATSIDEKLCLGEIVFLGEAIEERRRGVSPVAAEHVNFDSVSMVA